MFRSIAHISCYTNSQYDIQNWTGYMRNRYFPFLAILAHCGGGSLPQFIHFSLILPGPQITWKWTMYTDKLTTKCHICLFSSVHFAAINGHESIIQLLLSYKADVNSRSRTDATPLHVASQEGRLASVVIFRASMVIWSYLEPLWSYFGSPRLRGHTLGRWTQVQLAWICYGSKKSTSF